MSFRVQSLASGSSGNSTLVTHRDGNRNHSFLIDAGLSVRAMIEHLESFGLAPGDLDGIVVSHEHSDHIQGAYGLSRKFGVPLIANRRTLTAIYKIRTETAHQELPTGDQWRIGQLRVQTFSVPHDASEPVGISVRSECHKASFLTDLGSVTDSIQREVEGSDLLMIEMNHCVHRLHAGPYPDHLKRRILSNHGHLSNEVAVQFMVNHLAGKGPCSIWLAHLSKVNNRPKLALNYARATLKLESICPFVIDVALRDRPSVSWSPGRSNLQLNLF